MQGPAGGILRQYIASLAEQAQKRIAAQQAPAAPARVMPSAPRPMPAPTLPPVRTPPMPAPGVPPPVVHPNTGGSGTLSIPDPTPGILSGLGNIKDNAIPTLGNVKDHPGETIGATGGAGSVQVLYGESGIGLRVTRNQFWNESNVATAGTLEAGDSFGLSLAAGDVTGEGVDDLAIGAPQHLAQAFVEAQVIRGGVEVARHRLERVELARGGVRGGCSRDVGHGGER